MTGMSSCITSIIETTKGFLVKPIETFQEHEGTSLAKTFQYYAMLSFFYAILFGIVEGIIFYFSVEEMFADFLVIGGFMGFISWIFILFLIVFVFSSSIIGIFFSGLFQHIFVLLCGGEHGVAQTLKAMMYGLVPVLVLGWIPFINLIASIWSLVLMIIGIRELHKLSTVVAVVAVLLPIFLALLILVLITLFFVFFIGFGVAEALSLALPAEL
jgi:hypothetical protein